MSNQKGEGSNMENRESLVMLRVAQAKNRS